VKYFIGAVDFKGNPEYTKVTQDLFLEALEEIVDQVDEDVAKLIRVHLKEPKGYGKAVRKLYSATLRPLNALEPPSPRVEETRQEIKDINDKMVELYNSTFKPFKGRNYQDPYDLEERMNLGDAPWHPAACKVTPKHTLAKYNVQEFKYKDRTVRTNDIRKALLELIDQEVLETKHTFIIIKQLGQTKVITAALKNPRNYKID